MLKPNRSIRATVAGMDLGEPTKGDDPRPGPDHELAEVIPLAGRSASPGPSGVIGYVLEARAAGTPASVVAAVLGVPIDAVPGLLELAASLDE